MNIKEYSGDTPLPSVPRENPAVEYKCFEACNGFSPGIGWEFVQMVSQPDSVGYSSQSYYENGINKYQSMPHTVYGKCWLIFRRRRDLVIEEMQTLTQTLIGKQCEAARAQEEWKKVQEGLEKEIFTQRESLAEFGKSSVAAVSLRHDLQAALKKMEVDMAKLRHALGEIRMLEILGDAK